MEALGDSDRDDRLGRRVTTSTTTTRSAPRRAGRRARGARRWVLAGAGVLALALLPAVRAQGASPATGTLSLSSPQFTWTGASWPAGAGAAAHRGVEPVCPTPDPGDTVCDHITLTVDVPASYWASHYGGVRIRASWPDPNNKLEVAVYDAQGNLAGWGLNGGDSSVTIPAATGTYQIDVEPSLVVRPTGYDGLAEIVPLSKPPASPSLGGASAYTATPVAKLDPDHPPVNRPARYDGPPLQLVAHPVGHSTSEPTIGLDRTGAVFMDGGDSVDFAPPVQSTRWQPHVFGSFDGGRSWKPIESTAVDSFQMSTSDPYLLVDHDYGRVFHLNLQVSTFCCSFLSYSDDHGVTWTSTVATAGGVNDHPTLVSGAVPAGSNLVTLDSAFPRIVYYCVNQISDVGCTRSLDGGKTFERVGSPLLNQSTACAVSTTDHLTTDASGRVFLGSSGCNVPYVASSGDGGLTWTNATVTTGMLAAYHDVATAEDSAENVYALYTDAENSLPYLAVSRDHGVTWSTPVMVAPPDVHEAGMLTLSAGSPGRIAVGMVATTVDDTGDLGRPWSYRMAVTQDALDASPTFVSNVATIPDLGTKIVNRGECCDGMADFLGLDHSPLAGGAVWGSLSDPCTSGDCIGKRDGVNNLSRGMGYAVEQVGGPALVGPARYLHESEAAPASVAQPVPAPATQAASALATAIPNTGSAAAPWAAAIPAALLAGVPLRRRTRRRRGGGSR